MRLFGIEKLLWRHRLKITQWGAGLGPSHWGHGLAAQQAMRAAHRVNSGGGPGVLFRIYITHIPLRRRKEGDVAPPYDRIEQLIKEITRHSVKKSKNSEARFALRMLGFAKHKEGGRFVYFMGHQVRS